MRQQLNPQQKAAVETDSGKALVVAGAGSGKTRVLIGRIAHLIKERQVSPFEIMAFTFTRKAAGEMKNRLESTIEDAYKCTMGTMHSVALTFLYRFGELIGLDPRSITIYSDWESGELLRHIIKELGVKLTRKQAMKVLNHYYQTGQAPIPLETAFSVFKTFLARCRENNAMTYGMILIEFNRLLGGISDHVNFKYLLVDEIQDIDPLQWNIINRICSLFGTELFVVGDIDQSIYEFRGAIPGYLVEHQSEFEIFTLPVNYRSDANIVDFSNRMIANNKSRISKFSDPYHGAIKPVEAIEDVDSAKIVKRCKEILGKGHTKIAILSRHHFLLKKLDRLLTEEYMEHKYIGKETKFANSGDFRVFHAFMKLMINPLDNFSFMLIKDHLGISEREYIEIMKKSAAEASLGHAVGHFGAYKMVHDSPSIFFADPNDPPWMVARLIRNKFPELDPDENILEFIIGSPGAHVQSYLDWLATIDIQDEIKDDYDGIQLMTIHAAKGLEWPVVIVSGVNEGLLPSKQAIKSGDIEGERRLAYVAWTRAMDHLILAVRPEEKEFNGKIILTPVSRFVKESFPTVVH